MTSHVDTLNAACVRAATADEIPVIDVGDLLSGRPGSADDVARQIRQACTGTGFFYISSHGLEEQLASLLSVMQSYFSTPETDRALASIDRYQRGFRKQGSDQEAFKESFDIGVDLPLTHPAVENDVPMHGPNRWPEHFPALRSPSEAYFSASEALGRRLLAGFARSLGQAENCFEPHCTEAMVQMRMFHYPAPPSNSEWWGSPPHTDYGMITLLAQDPVGGLEIQNLGGEWVSAPYIKDTLVINVGDMFNRFTNGVYRSTVHRVMNRAGVDRYSVAMFYHLNADCMVTPFDTCCTAARPSRHKPIKYLTHIVSRFEQVLKAKF